ncbi:MAG: hypothetical protein PUF72_03805 [Clostridiales bacterium]|nr:hypothetical protein [Clostridiales bacterium]
MREYIAMPNLPNKRSRGVIISCRTGKDTLEELKQLKIEAVLSAELECLHPSVAAHPDMQIHHIGKNKLVCAKEAYRHYKALLPDAELICGTTPLCRKYPGDVLYNCVRLDNYLIYNPRSAAIEILSEYGSLKRIPVKQGYSKCSIAVVSKNAVITSDNGIFKALNKKLDVLKITEGFIKLDGMNYGFIGGATGLIDKNILAVNGSLKTHPDKDNITAFCKNHGVDIYELKKGVIEDIGSILPIF